jgi:hypothetical protein
MWMGWKALPRDNTIRVQETAKKMLVRFKVD